MAVRSMDGCLERGHVNLGNCCGRRCCRRKHICPERTGAPDPEVRNGMTLIYQRLGKKQPVKARAANNLSNHNPRIMPPGF